MLYTMILEFMKDGCCKHSFIGNPFISELLASKERLEATITLGIPKIIIQTECNSSEDMWLDEKKNKNWRRLHC